jgi:hypothetical protein
METDKSTLHLKEKDFGRISIRYWHDSKRTNPLFYGKVKRFFRCEITKQLLQKMQQLLLAEILSIVDQVLSTSKNKRHQGADKVSLDNEGFQHVLIQVPRKEKYA